MQTILNKTKHQITNYVITIIIIGLAISADLPRIVDQYFNKSLANNCLGVIAFFTAHYLIQLFLDIVIIIRFNKADFKKQITQYLKASYVQLFYTITIMLLVLWASVKVAPWFAIIVMFAAMSVQISLQKYWLKLQQSLTFKKLDTRFLNEILNHYNLKAPDILIAQTYQSIVKWVGESFRPQLIISNSMLQNLSTEDFNALVIHQIAAIDLKSRQRSITLAYTHNVILLLISFYVLETPFNSVGAIISIVLYYSLFSALTYLPLNLLSQRAIHEQDVFAIDHYVSKQQLQTITNNTEPQQIESPLYPYLPATARMSYIEKYEDNPWGAYQITQLANYMSWSVGNLMAKALPFNASQPNKWI